MKKTILAFVAAFMMLSTASAQKDFRLLNHLAIGAEVGTMGWGVDASVPVTPFFDVQAGFNMFPKVNFNTKISMNKPYEGIKKVPMRGTPTMKGGKVLVNFMPVPMITSFHVTAGAYFGSEEVMGLCNTEPMPAEIATYNEANPDDRRGLALGDYLLEPDAQGNIDAKLKVKPIKTYLGIGIGRGVPKSRVGFKMDLGCVLWGRPSVYCNDDKVLDTNQNGDGGGIVKVATKLKVYPVLNFRICGRII